MQIACKMEGTPAQIGTDGKPKQNYRSCLQVWRAICFSQGRQLSPEVGHFNVVVHYMGGAGGIEALHSAVKTIQLQRIAFVPAQHPDIAPVPEGVDVIHLGGSKKVSLWRFDALRLLIFVLRKGLATSR